MKRTAKLTAFLATMAILTFVAWCQAQLRFLAREAPLQTVVSGPFLFTTDLAGAEVESLSTELLALERRLTNELGLPRLAVPVRIFLFQNKTRYLRYIQQNLPALQRSAAARRGFFLLRDGQPHVFVHSSPELHGDLRHEFTHALLNTSVRGLPLWLDEGLAVYYETADESGWHAGHAALLRAQLRRGRPADLADLARMTDHTRMTNADYAAAWSWVHFLRHGPAELQNLLTDYLGDLRKRTPTDPIEIRIAQRLQDPHRSWLGHLQRTNPGSARR